MSLAIGSNTIKFVEKKGIKFFEGFNATIKNEKPVRVFFDGEMGETASIHVRDKKGNRLGFYDLKFNTPDKASMEGVQLYADEPHENVGEVLSLAALMIWISFLQPLIRETWRHSRPFQASVR